MVNSTLTTSTPNRGVSLRKTNKPLMEKRRRARINDSLSQLKSLVIHSSKKDSSQFSKLEKADILELTVKHLRGLQAQQQQQLHQQQQHHHHMSVQSAASVVAGNSPADTLINGKYRAGFVECANEVIRYLDQSQGLNPETKTKVVSHLAGCLQIVSNSTSTTHNPNPNPHQHHHPQSKIAPQPTQQPQTPAPAVMPQPQSQSTNAAAILAAAGNPTTTTTQLPNGQIIQIVSNPLQNVHQPSTAVATSAQNVLGLNSNPSGLPVAAQPVQNSSKPLPTQQLQQQQSTPTNPAYIHYAQPLHIQIPPIVSPILIQRESQQQKQQQQQQKQQQHQPKHIEIRESRNNYSATSSSSTLSSSPSNSSTSSLPDQVNDIVSSTSLPPSPPRHQRRISTSPPSSLYPGHPKARAQKQLNFFSQQEFNKSATQSDKFYSSSRIVKNALTPPSSSGSSSESENTSPLNLSQSPPFTSSSYHPKSQHRRHNPYSDSHKIMDIKQTSSSSVYTKPATLLGENSAFRDSNNNNISQGHNATSVIVNSKKCVDFSQGKFWSMMEDDRSYCPRLQNTPSPASSVGEERLWRPW